jgi:putative ABC transport system ATP-binding protein
MNNNQPNNSNKKDNDIFKLEKKELTENVVLCRGVSKTYKLPGSEDRVNALREINLSDQSEIYPIKRGEFVMIRGPSGGGKTTLLNILGTLDSEFEGELEILGTKITSQSTDEFLSQMRLKNIGFVFQTFNLISTMTAIGISLVNFQKMWSCR